MTIKDMYTNTHCGTKQTDRYPAALSDDFFRIDERSLEDLVAQVGRFARQMTHYDSVGGKATWENFFRVDMDELKRQMSDGSVEAHYALLLSFLKLYGKQQEQLNSILRRHMDFYYRDMLGFVPKVGSPGTVPVFFELSKGASNVFIPKGTRFAAGKDDDGKPVFYTSISDVSLNSAKLAGCKKNTSSGMYSLSLGDSTCSQPLVYHEVYIPIEGLDKLDGTIVLNLLKSISSAKRFEYTTNEGWEELKPVDNKLTIESDACHLAIYNKKVHQGKWNVECPLLRITCKDRAQLEHVIKWSKSISASVSGSKTVEIANKYGVVENKKGSMPFGPFCCSKDWFTLAFPFKPIVKSVKSILPTRSKLVNESAIGGSLKAAIQLASDGQAVESKVCNSSKDGLTYTLNVETYDQNRYAVDLAEHLVSMANQGSQGTKIEEPEHHSALELAAPMTFEYDFNLKGMDSFVISPSISEDPITNLVSFLSIGNGYKSELYAELKDFKEKGTISLYFELDPYIKILGKALSWSYFDGEQWQAISATDIVNDTTSGLTQSGIVVLNVQADNVKWLKASFIEDYPSEAVRNILSQVVELEYDSTSAGKPSNGVALPAGTITKLESSIAGVKSVSQLYAGKKGESDETDIQFESRVSETLRHKGRAWSSWDYERLVLEHFPDIASVQCYPAYNDKWQMTAGAVLLAVIPRKQDCADCSILQPVVEETTLNEIMDYIGNRCTSHATIYAANPVYDKIHVKCCISLRKGYTDETYYSNLVSKQLMGFFAPWTCTEQKVTFNSRVINESDILAFISQLPFVDKIWDLNVTVEGKTIVHGTDICPESVGHLLTSDTNHEITFQSND